MMDNLKIPNSDKVFKPTTRSENLRRRFYKNCSDANLKIGRRGGIVDSVLKLYTGCPSLNAYRKQ
jgi:hypothetical protein